MQLSHNGIEALKEHEGCVLHSYLDTGDVWTIGYGTTKIKDIPVTRGMSCTNEQATQWLYADVAWAQEAVNNLVKVPLAQHQFDALVSFVYNIGASAFKDSTMLRLLNQGDYAGAAKQFDRWNKDNGRVIPGLVARRKVERSMFEGNL